MYRYLHRDVCTGRPLEGNKLAVFAERGGLASRATARRFIGLQGVASGVRAGYASRSTSKATASRESACADSPC